MPRLYLPSTDPKDPADQPVDYCRPCWSWHGNHPTGYWLKGGKPLTSDDESDHPDYGDCSVPGMPKEWAYTCDECGDTLTKADN